MGRPAGRLRAVLRKFLFLFLLTSVFWQAIGVAGKGTLVSGQADLAHAALHWQEANHHHHDDGSYGFDNSKASAKHLTADGVVASPALVQSNSVPVADYAAVRPPMTDDAASTPPYLERLRRPPRLSA
jgi:hypothetical protein